MAASGGHARANVSVQLSLFQELVTEKLRTQQMNNDLEKLTHELEKIGLNKERLLHDESSDDRSAKAKSTQRSCDAAPAAVNTHRNSHTAHMCLPLGSSSWKPSWSRR